jgi:hypothetical protein
MISIGGVLFSSIPLFVQKCRNAFIGLEKLKSFDSHDKGNRSSMNDEPSANEPISDDFCKLGYQISV